MRNYMVSCCYKECVIWPNINDYFIKLNLQHFKKQFITKTRMGKAPHVGWQSKTFNRKYLLLKNKLTKMLF